MFENLIRQTLVTPNVCRLRYQEILTKGKFNKFEKSWPNRQTKTIQYKATKYISKISTIIILV